MPVPIVCPSCKRSGKLPDNFPGGKIKCPGCGVISEVPAPSRAVPAPPRAKPAQPSYAALDESDERDYDDEPAPRPQPRGRSAASAPASASKTPMLAIALGAGGAVALLITAVIAVVLMSGGRKPDPEVRPVPPVAAGESEPAAEPAPTVEPTATAATPSPAATAPAAVPSASFSSVSYANETPAQTIQRVKDATVLVKIQFGKGRGSGSGFVIQARGDSALIATNNHVVSPPADHQGESGAAGAKPELTVVLHSGTPTEQVVPATVLAADASDRTRDLAILSVKGVTSLPKPIDLAQKAELAETMSVLIYGFPFGEMLSAGKRNPEISITKGSISSIRRNDQNQVALVQIDGSINPGNSGGPVVDEKGRLVGVSVAKVRNTNIGFAIAPSELNRMLEGRVGEPKISLTAVPAATADLQLEVPLVDPLNQVRGVGILFVPDTGAPPLAPGADGRFPPLPGAQSVALKVDQGIARGKIQSSLPDPKKRGVLIQFSYKHANGRTVYTSPVSYSIPDKPGLVRAPGSELDMEQASAEMLGRLGKMVDPDKDCDLKRGDKTVKITIPGTLHTLSPQLRSKKKQTGGNAPRLLASVKGDFIAQVRVAGVIQPGNTPATDARGRKVPLCVQGGGLLVWQDKDNFLRLERSVGTASGHLTQINRLILEAVQDGKEAGSIYMDIGDGPLYVMLLRQSGQIRPMFSNDGHRWSIFKNGLSVVFPDSLSIGISAFNLSKRPYTAEFDSFRLMDDKDELSERFKQYTTPGE